MPISGSTVVRRQLGRRLRSLRDTAGKTERDVEEATLASRAKLWRIESGKVPAEVADRQVKLRAERQLSLTTRVPPLALTAVLGAGVLARPVGGPDVMAEQIARLKELNALDNVDIRVLPWQVGAHAAMVGAF